ncbi:twin-arginine translocation pathway signal protein [Mycolicibacterium litorale]|nr:twin-arginine translocation pathway signal protein [Mycolicibacterium litorale]
MRELTWLSDYQQALAERNRAAATDIVTRLLVDGVDPVTVLTEVVAAAQREVGLRWQRGEWTVADEHACTAISVAATRAVAEFVGQLPLSGKTVLVACAEREWHELPAMIIACSLRSHGWNTTLLGAATSPMRFSQHLADIGPDAVAVSCSVLGALPTTRRFIEAASAAGVPVLVGGQAFGRDDARARALGATAWAGDAHSAVAAMNRLPAVVAALPNLPAAAVTEQTVLDVRHRAIVDSVRASWSLTRTPSPVGAGIGTDTLNQTLHAISAALLTGDSRPISETAEWVCDILRARSVNDSAVTELAQLLVAVLADLPLSRRLVEDHFTRCPGQA